MTRLLLALAAAAWLCCHAIVPARAGTIDRAIERLCPGRAFLAPMVEWSASLEGLRPAVVLALVYAESRCDHMARGKRREVGLGQVRGVARRGLSTSELLDPQTNLHATASWLAEMVRKCGRGRRYARKIMRIARRIER